MKKDRFLAFNDAIVAIIATVMVLELRAPTSSNINALSNLIVPMFAYALSFFMIILVWYNHHELYKKVTSISVSAYWYNAIWLFITSLFPFATSWVGKMPNDFLPEFTYLLLMIIWMGSFQLMQNELRRENPKVHDDSDIHSLPIIVRYGLPLLGFGIVWIWPPIGLFSILILTLAVIVQFAMDIKRSRKY